MTAQQTYYFGAGFYSGNDSGDFPVMVELIHSWGAYGTTTPPTCTKAGVYSFPMPAGPVTVSAEFSDLGVSLAGHTLSLGSNIGVNFYMTLTEL